MFSTKYRRLAYWFSHLLKNLGTSELAVHTFCAWELSSSLQQVQIKVYLIWNVSLVLSGTFVFGVILYGLILQQPFPEINWGLKMVGEKSGHSSSVSMYA